MCDFQVSELPPTAHTPGPSPAASTFLGGRGLKIPRRKIAKLEVAGRLRAREVAASRNRGRGLRAPRDPNPRVRASALPRARGEGNYPARAHIKLARGMAGSTSLLASAGAETEAETHGRTKRNRSSYLYRQRLRATSVHAPRVNLPWTRAAGPPRARAPHPAAAAAAQPSATSAAVAPRRAVGRRSPRAGATTAGDGDRRALSPWQSDTAAHAACDSVELEVAVPVRNSQTLGGSRSARLRGRSAAAAGAQ